MHSEIPPHEKIRFRRDEIAPLDAFPSAGPPATRRQAGSGVWRPMVRATLRGIGGIAAVALAIVGLVYVALAAGIGSERLRVEAETAVARLVGDEFSTRIGGVRLSFDGPRMLALEVRDAGIAASATGREVMTVDSLRFGVGFLPLLGGDIVVGNASIDGARVHLDALPAREGGGAALAVLDDHGRIDPDAAIAALFGGARTAVEMLDRQGTDRISLANVQFVTTPGSAAVALESATLEDDHEGRLQLSASILAGERPIAMTARASKGNAPGEVDVISVELDMPAVEAPDATAPGTRFGAANLRIFGSQGQRGEQIAVLAKISGADIDLADGDRLQADIDLNAVAAIGTDKVEIDRLDIASGRSTWRFHGALGPAPVSDAASGAPGYRFELVSDGSTVAPAGSQEPALPVVARFAGHVRADGGRVAVEEIGIRTGQGELDGTATITFEAGRSPGIDLQLNVGGMPIGHVKQLWPWFAARGARNWVAENMFGGRAEDGLLRLSVPPGRMGNGVGFGPEEVWGRFSVNATRFDVAGRIPPVRDGFGSVEFRGSDVDIALQRGTVYMPSGRTVDASDGELMIRQVEASPLVGKLRIDVKGTADAVLELATYDPIDVSRFIDVAADDLSGTVEGEVTADIPLQKDIPIESLDWRVALDYEALAIAQPFEDQMVTEAKGSIMVDPASAVISARARLNGAPARIEMVEPLGGSTVDKERRIVLELDNKARDAIAPGLNTLLAGTTEVELDDSDKSRRRIKADLAKSVLSVPWAGWSKGAGVPAKVDLTMTTSGDRVELTDFKLTGETFGATGSITLNGGEVTSARFAPARLNRNDDFTFDMKARGRGYAITIRGKSIDARSVVKLYSQDEVDASSGASSTVPVSVDLEIDTMTGFHGEVFRNVKLSYAGTGARTDKLEFTAVTDTGNTVTYRDGREADTRKVSMTSADAGSVLRFLDIYEHMEGGKISLSLAAKGDAPLVGQVDARDFWVVDEPRLKSLVSTQPLNDGRSLNQAVRGEIDTTRVQFARGFAQVEKATGSLAISKGVLRGPLIGSTFQGTLYDSSGNMAMTGTFMPAYGLNRIFGEIPLIGQILGNGRDRGLIGITFKLSGKAGEPQLQVNPLSVIAPGIFRSVFEFR